MSRDKILATPQRPLYEQPVSGLLPRASNDAAPLATVSADAVPVHVRDAGVDALRGLAIITMVAANMAAYSLVQPHPLALRVYGSLAAPTFIFLAGMMGGRARVPFVRGIRRASVRMLVLWAWAVSIDVFIWGIAPFNGFDVLYLIGLALPVAELCRALDLRLHALTAGALILLTPLLQQRLGYRLELSETGAGPVAWRRLVIDGWFPLFPWLGVALCGALLGRLRSAGSRWTRPRALLGAAAVLFTAGCADWFLQRHPFPIRGGYSELFYPPSLAMVGVALGCLLALFSLVSAWQGTRALRWLEIPGRASLLLYVVHSAVIAFVLKRVFRDRPPLEFLLGYLLHLGLLWLLARSVLALSAKRGAPGSEGWRPLSR